MQRERDIIWEKYDSMATKSDSMAMEEGIIFAEPGSMLFLLTIFENRLDDFFVL